MVYEQKPVKLDDLNKADEKEIRREKKSALRKGNAEEGKLLKIINFYKKRKSKRTVKKKKRRSGNY